MGGLTSIISVSHADVNKCARGGALRDMRICASKTETTLTAALPILTGGIFSGDTKNKELGAHFVGRGRSKRYAEAEREHKGGQTSEICHWDVAPPKEYFDELARVSKNQIIWGGNYFGLPPTRCFLVWQKLSISENFSMAMCEYAWTSFNDNAKLFACAPQGNAKDQRFHPTQKPVALYKWVLSRYAKAGDRILDTHLGSQSSRIAAYDLGLDFWGYEIDEFYFTEGNKRFEEHTRQQSIFDMVESAEQLTIGETI